MRTSTIRIGALLVAALTWTGCQLGADPDELVKKIDSTLTVTDIDDFECYRAEIQSVEQPPQYFPKDEGATEKVVNGAATIPVEVTRGTFTITKIRLIIPENCGAVHGEMEYRGDPDSDMSGSTFSFDSGDTQSFPRRMFK